MSRHPADHQRWQLCPRVGFAVPISGIKTTGVIRCDQPRTLDLEARNGRKVDDLPPEIMDEVLAIVGTIFE